MWRGSDGISIRELTIPEDSTDTNGINHGTGREVRAEKDVG